VDPLFVFSFLQRFVDVLQDYFGEVSASVLKDNFDVVYQVSYPLSHVFSCIVYLMLATRRDDR
jgi:hypothetical protein